MTRQRPAPLIDVLIPAYNAAPTVVEAIGSIQRQSIRDIVIHVIDDGSTDATADLLADLARDDARIVVHRTPNRGIVDALNHGLGFCTADYVARHDADDIAYPGRLDAQWRFLETHPDTVAVGAAVRHIDGKGVPTGTVVRLPPPEMADIHAVPAREPYIIHPFLMARRSALAAAGGYRYAHHAEDSDLYWRLHEIGRLHNLPEILGDYRMHDESISSRSIVNGRIMSIGSQLAAFSARRRSAGEPDIGFAKAQLPALTAAGTLAEMVSVASGPLTPGERAPFAEAVCAKLLELASYRPYELDESDCRFIRSVADRGFGHLPAPARALQVRRLTGSAARLAAGGKMRQALLLVPPRYRLLSALRLLVRIGFGRRVRRALGIGRDTPTK